MEPTPAWSTQSQSEHSGPVAESLPQHGLSEELLRSIVNSLADGIVVSDPAGKFLLFNPAAEVLLGKGLSHASPSEWSRHYGCFHPDGVTLFQMEELPLVRAIKGEEVSHVEMFVRNDSRSDGVWIHCNARPLRARNAAIIGGAVTLHDVTGRRSAEAALRKSQEEDFQFQERLMSLIEVSHELSRAQSLDELLRLTIELGRSRLGFDRLGIRLLSDDGQTSMGCYGTDESGRLRDEHHVQYAVDGLSSEMLYRRQDYNVWQDIKLGNDRGDTIGFGTRASASIWDGTRIVGVIHADNLLKRAPISDRDGRFLAQFASMLGQLSLRKNAEEEIRKLNAELQERAIETETRYRLVARATRDAIWDWNLLTGEVEWNEGVEHLFGYSPHEVSPDIEWRSSRIHPDDHARVWIGLQKAIDSGESTWSAEYRFACRDNSYATVIDRGYVVRDEYGRPKRMVGAMFDLTPQKRAQEELQDSVGLLEATLESTADGLLVVDRDGHIITYNQKFADMWGIPPEVLEHRDDGLAIQYVLDKLKDTESFRARIEELHHHSEVVSNDIIEFKDGRIFERYSQARRFGAEVIGRVWSFRDVTHRNRLQRQLLESQKLESIGTLAGGIAHDFNNLLVVILGNASIHLRDKSLPEKLRASLTDIVDASERGSSLTHQLLAYARGGLQRFGPVDLNELVDSVIRMLRRTTPPQLEFVIELSPQLPAVHADSSQLEHVIMNLCLNAVQACREHSVIVITTAMEQIDATKAASLEIQPGEYARLRVTDSGCGMSEETMERIFEPFFTTKITGRGMGLAAAQGIVNSHHGQIRVNSTLGEGTTMAVWLPISVETAKQRQRLAKGRALQPPTGSETILILDDDVAITRAVSKMLQSLGYCVVEYNDADETLAFLSNNSEDVHLVIQDLNVPLYSGQTMFGLIRERLPNVPILLASGFEEPQLSQRARDWGAAGYIQKPFSISILANTVRKVLDETTRQDV